jgi:hypothetical protein
MSDLDYQEVDSFDDNDEIYLPDNSPEGYEEVDETDYEQEEVPNNNPALTELYEILPMSLHGMVQPVLDKWQAGVDAEFEKIAPYRKFADAGLAPTIIEASLELASEISSNPRAVYDELAERYGWRQAEQMMTDALSVASKATESTDYSLFGEEEDTDVEQDPTSLELAALRAELEALRDSREAEIEAANDETYEYEIETSLETLREDYGDFDEEGVIRRAMLLADQYPDAELPQLIGAAFEQYQGEIERMRSSIKVAPRVAGGTANTMPAAPPVKLTTREERVAAIEAIVKNNLRGY